MTFKLSVSPKDKKICITGGDLVPVGMNPKITNQDNSLEQENSQDNLKEPFKNYKSIVGTR